MIVSEFLKLLRQIRTPYVVGQQLFLFNVQVLMLHVELEVNRAIDHDVEPVFGLVELKNRLTSFDFFVGEQLA